MVTPAFGVATPASASRGAEIRAANAQDFFHYVGELKPGGCAELEARVPKDVFERVFDASRLGWISIEDDLHLVNGTVAVLGPKEATFAWRRFTSRKLRKSPMIGALVEGTVRLFGLNVGTMVRVFARGFPQSYRNVATLDIERGDQRAAIHLRDVHPLVYDSEAYRMQFRGVFHGLYDIALTKPDLDLTFDPSTRTISAELRY